MPPVTVTFEIGGERREPHDLLGEFLAVSHGGDAQIDGEAAMLRHGVHRRAAIDQPHRGGDAALVIGHCLDH